jgi:hypothetical protein
MPKYHVLHADAQAVTAGDAETAATLVAPLVSGDLIVLDADEYERMIADADVFHVTRQVRVTKAS